MNFQTTITRIRKRGTLELLALAKDAESDDELEEYEEVELEVEVFYTPGYYQSATYHNPAEGEDPELTSVVLTKEDGETVEFMDKLNMEEWGDLIRRAWDDQEDRDRDEGDPDAYDNARDLAMEDAYDGLDY